jgi:hypothetical protein
MKALLFSTMALMAMAASGHAQAQDTPETSDLPAAAAADDSPAMKQDGMTKTPTAQPKTGGIPDKAMKDAPGTMGGTTSDPTAEPDTDSLTDADK